MFNPRWTAVFPLKSLQSAGSKTSSAQRNQTHFWRFLSQKIPRYFFQCLSTPEEDSTWTPLLLHSAIRRLWFLPGICDKLPPNFLRGKKGRICALSLCKAWCWQYIPALDLPVCSSTTVNLGLLLPVASCSYKIQDLSSLDNRLAIPGSILTTWVN